MGQIGDTQDNYKKVLSERKAYVDAILKSSSRKKTVVAGPGTGKTHLFKEVLAEKENCLTLTFVNALVEDLSLGLGKLSQVKTLHGYARGILGSNVKVFPKLSEVIKQDAKILLGTDIDFDMIFHNRVDDDPHIEFFRERKKYYDNYYGYSSIVFAAVKLFEAKNNKIPTYQQILVDEFQDFNKLEVSLIDLLSQNSPVLLVGDDDQALYGFKGASEYHIRQRHDEANTDYASFTLPYCSRCTRVIIDAVNDLIAKATEKGSLRGRIDKQFWYFENEEKDKVSELYPKIAYAQVHARQIPWFIEQLLNEIAGEQQDQFSSLVIAPTKRQCHSIATALRKKGLGTIKSVDLGEDKETEFLEGLKLLIRDSSDNLGWRIAAKHFLSSGKFSKLLSQTTEPNAKRISEIIDKGTKKKVEEILKTVKALIRGATVNDEDLNNALKELGMDGHDISLNKLYNRITFSTQRLGNPGLRKVPINVTTIQGSKGLSSDFVFITYFDDRYFIKDNDKSKFSDQDICNFIVSLTRAKKKVFLISSSMGSKPTFLDWIDASRVEII